MLQPYYFRSRKCTAEYFKLLTFACKQRGRGRHASGTPKAPAVSFARVQTMYVQADISFFSLASAQFLTLSSCRRHPLAPYRTTRCSMGKSKEPFPLLSLPKPALQAVVDVVGRTRGIDGDGGALHGLRGTCRLLRAEANACTRLVSTVSAHLLQIYMCGQAHSLLYPPFPAAAGAHRREQTPGR